MNIILFKIIYLDIYILVSYIEDECDLTITMNIMTALKHMYKLPYVFSLVVNLICIDYKQTLYLPGILDVHHDESNTYSNLSHDDDKPDSVIEVASTESADSVSFIYFMCMYYHCVIPRQTEIDHKFNCINNYCGIE
jgi:hypothetical protein